MLRPATGFVIESCWEKYCGAGPKAGQATERLAGSERGASLSDLYEMTARSAGGGARNERSTNGLYGKPGRIHLWVGTDRSGIWYEPRWESAAKQERIIIGTGSAASGREARERAASGYRTRVNRARKVLRSGSKLHQHRDQDPDRGTGSA